MSNEDWYELFRSKCDELGQSVLAKAISRSPSAVNQLYHGTYKGAPDAILKRVVEVYGGLYVHCPLHGSEIRLKECAENRRRPFAEATNSHLVRIFRACNSCKQINSTLAMPGKGREEVEQ